MDWSECGRCAGMGKVPALMPHGAVARGVESGCPNCGGYGSLRAAALAHAIGWQQPSEAGRCEGCGHPMSDNPWGERADGEPLLPHEAEAQLEYALGELRAGNEPDTWERLTHWSSCDEGCQHDGPFRYTLPDGRWQTQFAGIKTDIARGVASGARYEASWRPVDVRAMTWPHDLRPESLMALCLRCWAARQE